MSCFIAATSIGNQIVVFRKKLQSAVVVGVLLTNSAICCADENQSTNKLLKTFVDEFVEISPGVNGFPAKVIIGSSDGASAERPPFEAIRKEKFSISKYEVYQNIYEEIMGNNPSRWKGGRNSAERMTYGEAEEFCRRMTERLRKEKLIAADQIVRLPTEVEWEYCTRAGTDTPYSFGKSATAPNDQGKQATLLNAYGWHTGNAAGNDPAVGVLKPNPWGLYDVHGYLSEFCQGPWKQNYESDAEVVKEAAPIRGGSWKDHYSFLTSSSRRPFPMNGRDDAVGFRCVLVKE